MHYTWTCHCCGRQFEELPLAYGLDAPDPWFELNDTERQTRSQIDSDRCIIDGRQFFVRGCLDVPIVGREEFFSWGVWVSVSKRSFDRILELWDTEFRDDEPPMFGWVCNNIHIYPQTFALKTHLHLRNDGLRPFIELEPTDHPLAIEQRQGLSLLRVEEIVSAVLRHH